MNQTGAAHLFIIVILILGVFLGVFLMGKTQVFRPKASENAQPLDNAPYRPAGSISAAPNPCQIPSGQEVCSSTISWTSTAASNITLRVKESPGSLFASGISGSQIAPWIRASGATFELYSDEKLLSSVYVSGQSPQPSQSSQPLHKIGDLDNNGKVDIIDINNFLNLYRQNDLRADLNHDGEISIYDFNQIVASLVGQ